MTFAKFKSNSSKSHLSSLITIEGQIPTGFSAIAIEMLKKANYTKIQCSKAVRLGAESCIYDKCFLQFINFPFGFIFVPMGSRNLSPWPLEIAIYCH